MIIQRINVASALTSTVFIALAASATALQVDRPEAGLPVGIAREDWVGIRQAYEAERHAIRPVENGFRATNPGQGWITRFDGGGFTTQPGTGGWTWGLELVSYGVRGDELGVTVPSCVDADGQRLTYAWDANVEEWYVNDSRGLEHGYTLYERPSAAEGDADRPLVFTLRVRGGLTTAIDGDGRGARFQDEHGATLVTYSGLHVFDADGRDLAARMDANETLLRITVDDRGARYPVTIDPLAEQAYLKASNTGANDRFGTSVSISGDTVIVGAPREASQATGVNNPGNDNNMASSGAAYVFVRSGSTWSQQAYLKASNTQLGDFFGEAVAVSGDLVVVGAPQEDSGSNLINGNQNLNGQSAAGAAYVFVRSGTTWSQEAYLKASNSGVNHHFGIAVTADGNTVVVGAFREASDSTGVNGDQTASGAGSSGAAYVFVQNGTTWSQEAYIKASNTDASDLFASSVSLSGDTLIVGAPQEASDATGVNGSEGSNGMPESGAAYVFVRTGTNWTQEAYLKASNTGPQEQFGYAVGVSGDRAVVGARWENSAAQGVNGDQSDNSADGAGAAYVFVRTGSVWNQQAYLKGHNTGPGDTFGSAVGVSGDTVVVGSPNEGVQNPGAAYVFDWNGLGWVQNVYLKGANTEFIDTFGDALAISGDTIAVGAHGESSSATGVGGDASDDSAPAAGAAYVFAPGSGAWNVCIGELNQDDVRARMSFNGSLSVADDDFEMCVDGLSFGSEFGLFVMGDTPAQIPFGAGYLCIDPAGALHRLNPILSFPMGTDLVCRDLDFGTFPGDQVAAGSTWFFQFWYRELSQTNLSDALSVCFGP